MLYMRYTHTESEQLAFWSEGHRARYLRSSALINPPPATTPLYAIQYLGFDKAPLYVTPVESLVLSATSSAYYLSTTVEMKDLVGLWDASKSYSPSGPDPSARLNQPRFLWRETPTESEEAMIRTMGRPSSVEELYEMILERCTPTPGGVASTFDASELRSIFPRPERPEPGIALGGGEQNTSNASQNRRGVPRKSTRATEEDARQTRADAGGERAGDRGRTFNAV